ncbi:integrase core domain-containing protein [Hymenobacter agri]
MAVRWLCIAPLASNLFRSRAHVCQLVNEWMFDYNIQRPYQSLHFLTPIE